MIIPLTTHPSSLTPHSLPLTTHPQASAITPHPSLLAPHPSLLTLSPQPSLLTPHPSPLTPHPSLLAPHPSLLTLSPRPSPLTLTSYPSCPNRELRQSSLHSQVAFVTQLHAWWHFFAGLGTYLHILSSSLLRMKLLGYKVDVRVSSLIVCTVDSD